MCLCNVKKMSRARKLFNGVSVTSEYENWEETVEENEESIAKQITMPNFCNHITDFYFPFLISDR